MAQSHAVGYVRVSTQEQAQKGLGLDVQREAIAGFCRDHGLQLVATFEDPGVSGTTALHEREGLTSALGVVRGSQDSTDMPAVTALVVARFDRLARDTLQALLIEKEFEQAGAQVLYGDGPNGPEYQTLREMLHVMASAERRAVVARLAAGRRAKAMRGGYAGGRPPFGYDAVGGELVAYAPEAKIVQWVFRRVAQDGWSVRRVARELTDRTGKKWGARKVHAILRRADYKRGVNGHRIVDPRVWNKAQAQLAERRPR